MSTPICVIGTIATAPRLLRSASNVAFCTFRLASNERRYDREQGKWVDGDTSWFSVNSFRSLAEHADGSFSKGDRIVVSGKLRTREWSKDGKSGTVMEIEAEALGHDLRWGVSAFTKRVGADPAGSTADTASGPESSVSGPTEAAVIGEQPGWSSRPAHPDPDGVQEGAGAPTRRGDGFVPAAA
ncbi:single-stranded DNA-binding protein [Leucobacter sp. wl10]|uniref:single-stranded DNA-binding protein n=1 Tax=Leucobacter sp. wl10 TaxID=2304677 RepID=UPI000E5A12A5|nr:single-stranded DNA-binding protein [Leucobacter sp. wl10]RGE22524.1 single-stranded DNA-binding protein [Leucobacter sp. wl10]